MAREKSPELKAAVLSALLQGQTVSHVAREYKISRRAVMQWRLAAGINATPVAQEKQDEIGELVATYLRSALLTLAVQQEAFRDKAWLAKQDAADVGVLHGITADKAVRILEALEAAGGEEG